MKRFMFVTIRRRGQSLVEHIAGLADYRWKKVKVEKSGEKSRTVTMCEETSKIKGYNGHLRQIFIKDNGKKLPAILMTNDFIIKTEDLLRKYSRRWLVETEISEHIDFFHLNRNSSGIVVKVDFDLTMTILAHNIYRLFCSDIDGYSHCEAQTIFDKFISVPGQVQVEDKSIIVKLKRKRTLPILLEKMAPFQDMEYQWLGKKNILFVADTTT